MPGKMPERNKEDFLMKAKTKFTRLWSILLVLVMVVGMLPTVALATGSVAATADFSADPTAALTLLNTYKNAGAEDSTWDSSTRTLTLKGVNFVTTAATAVILPPESKIVLADGTTNTITGGNSDSLTCYGICAEGSLTISGSGKLDVTGGTATNGNSYGIDSETTIDISGADVTAIGGTATNGNSYGISTYKDVTIESGTVTATGGTASNSKGIFVNSNSVTIGSGKVEATGGTARSDSYGIDSASVNIGGGTVTAKGGETTNGYSYGISSLYDIKISDGTVTAEGGTATNGRSYGIYANSSFGSISVSGGTVTAKVGAVLTASALSKKPRELPNAYQWRISESGAYNQYPDSAYTFDSSHTYLEIKEPEYTVTVTNGTASPSQAAAGATVTLTANTAPSGQIFDKWVVVSGGITLADATSATTTFTMPAGDVSVKATYHTHSYGSEWKSNADKHWHECACGDKSAEAVHTAGDWITDTPATATTDGTKHKACTACGYVMENGTIPATGYTVSFDANGGTGTMADVTGVSGTYTLPENGFTAPEGKQFKCWSVGGTEKAARDKITVTADTTVKAVWENIPATSTEYDILDGANSSWTHDSDGSLSIRGSGAFSEFVGVKVDGKSVDEKYYTVKEGSTIVTLKADYLNTLTVGSHILEIIWTDGSASTAFTVSAQTVVESPQTGDNSMMALWIAVLFVSGFGVVATAVYGKKRKSVK